MNEITDYNLSDGQVRQLARHTLESQNNQCEWCSSLIEDIGSPGVLYSEYGEPETQSAEVTCCLSGVAARWAATRVWELDQYFTDEEPEVTA